MGSNSEKIPGGIWWGRIQSQFKTVTFYNFDTGNGSNFAFLRLSHPKWLKFLQFFENSWWVVVQLRLGP